MTSVVRSAVASAMRLAARRAPRAPPQRRLGDRDRAIALVEQEVREQLRARGAAVQLPREEMRFFTTYTGVMLGVLMATVWRRFNPPKKTSLEILLDNNASEQGSGVI